ncbi:MAG TPA: efflux RND transporter permease subunit, partial [candidate division Zixibacteria bacterium]|nr:efflux RND transporter permease subunit [candidate division Zixibacteria bacterium]
MRNIIDSLIRYPIWVTVIMFSVIGFGLISLTQLRYSFFPEIEPDIVTIQVAFPGASPEEVSEGVTLRIEEALDGIDGVERVTSVSRENVASVTVESVKDTDMDRLVADIKNAIDRIGSFPGGIEKPVIFEQQFRTRVLNVMIYGDADLYNLKYVTEDLRDRLLASEEISQVEIEGLPALELSIEISEAALRRYGLTFREIADAVSRSNIDISGGKFETPNEEILIRAYGRGDAADELLKLPVRGRAAGAIVFLSDVATVTEQWEDTPNKRYYNGKPALSLVVDQSEGEDMLAIRERVQHIIDQFNEEERTLQAVATDDRTIPLRQRLNLLLEDGFYGLLLVLIALG